MQTELPLDIAQLHQEKMDTLLPRQLTEIGDYKASDCIPIAEAVLLNGLKNTKELEGQPLFFTPSTALKAEKNNVDLDTSKSENELLKNFIKMKKIEALAINFPKSALSFAELRKAVEFSAGKLVEKMLAVQQMYQEQKKEPLKLIRAPVEVTFEAKPADDTMFVIHVTCKMGLDYLKKEATT
jgi:hypothetical protein